MARFTASSAGSLMLHPLLRSRATAQVQAANLRRCASRKARRYFCGALSDLVARQLLSARRAHDRLAAVALEGFLAFPGNERTPEAHQQIAVHDLFAAG